MPEQPPRQFSPAPIDRITHHPELLAEVILDLCGWEPEDYAVSDESLLSDMVDLDTDRGALYAAVAARYGVTVPQDAPEPYLWDLIDRIASARAAKGGV